MTNPRPRAADAGSGSDMPALAPCLGKLDLPLALGVAPAILIRTRIETVRTRHAGSELRRRQLARRQRMAAGAAQFRLALGEAMRHRNPFVEDEALALPEALFGRNLLEISEDAALEMKDILEAERLDVGRRLF